MQENTRHDWSRRSFVQGLSGLAALAALPGTVRAQPGTVAGKILVGFPAGGTMDTVARRLAEAWRSTGTYVVDNRVGAAGRLATAQLKREKADGSVLLCSHTTAFSIYPHVYPKLGYDPVLDLKPVAALASTTSAFAISSAVPASVRNLADYIRWTRDKTATNVYASPAAGTLSHFLGYRLDQAARIGLTHVPYKGSVPAMQDLLGGQVPAYIGFVGDFLPHLASGKLRLLAVTSERRSRFLPDVPTFAEQGYPTVTGSDNYGFFAPPQTPDAIVATLSEAVRSASRAPALIAAFEQSGLETTFIGPSDYHRLITAERETWRPVVAASGFVVNE
jgi:tripartite-type tricarboxylate transporter receptor subunit TctC